MTREAFDPSQERASEPAGLDVEALAAALEGVDVDPYTVTAEYARLTASAAAQERP